MFSESDIRAIRTGIGAMGEGEFERFICVLLPRVSEKYQDIQPSYNFLGKTTKGKCDAHIHHKEDDTYTAVVCTTQQSGVKSKVLDDLKKLRNAEFAEKIRGVVLCVNSSVQDEVESYREFCRSEEWIFDLFSLESISTHAIRNHYLLPHHIRMGLTEVGVSEVHSRKFLAGPRVLQIRNELGLTASELIEVIDFPSEASWSQCEHDEADVEELYLIRASNAFGVALDWLKHGKKDKYPRVRIYDYESEIVAKLGSEPHVASYALIDPKRMEMVFAVKQSEYRWQVLDFAFSMDFWDWFDDHHHIPRIYDLLCLINKTFRHSYGRIVASDAMAKLKSSDVFPGEVVDGVTGNSYWFEDLFDLDHKYPIGKDGYRHYGKWFEKLQASFRSAAIGA